MAEADEVVAQLEADAGACLQWTSEVRSIVADASGLVQNLEERWHAFHGNAQASLESLTSTLAHVRGKMRDDAEGTRTAVNEAIAKVDAFVDHYGSRADSLVARLADVGHALQRSEHAIQEHAKSVGEHANTYSGDLKTLLESVQSRGDALGEQIRQQLHTRADSYARAIDQITHDLDSKVTRSFEEHVVASTHELHQGMEDALSHYVSQLDQSTSRLEGAVSTIFNQFADSQAHQMTRLSDEFRASHESAQRAMTTIRSAMENLTSISTEVHDSMGHTHVGLKVTVGSLEKVVQVLDDIKL